MSFHFVPDVCLTCCKWPCWIAQLTRKPHARQPLPVYAGPGPFPHPYEFEIQNLMYAPWMLAANTEHDFAPLSAVPLHYVDTLAAFDELLEKLSSPDVVELAIDLEAHNIRSYSGIVCLMQLSTRSFDAIVDTLALRSQMPRLLDVFTDPNVVKVLHGCRSDVVWLQHNFGLYLVNVFDTGEAARVLKYPSFGLAHLLDTFCKVKAQKQFQVRRCACIGACRARVTWWVVLQLADWRVRPIPAEMLQYAREDTHYLVCVTAVSPPAPPVLTVSAGLPSRCACSWASTTA